MSISPIVFIYVLEETVTYKVKEIAHHVVGAIFTHI